MFCVCRRYYDHLSIPHILFVWSLRSIHGKVWCVMQLGWVRSLDLIIIYGKFGLGYIWVVGVWVGML